MPSEILGYSHDERTFAGHLVRPETPRGAVLVLHGGAGLSDHERRWCDRLAAEGFAALAPDLFGEPFRDRQHAMTIIGALAGDPDRLRGRLAAALGALRQAARGVPASALGFCFGGMAALELARSGADLTAAVSLHGGLTTRRPAETGAVKAKVLVCTGAADPFATREHRAALEDELTSAGASWSMLLFGGVLHGFTHEVGPWPPGNAYDATAHAASWRAALAALAA
jgi:dienelactone hydrolase